MKWSCQSGRHKYISIEAEIRSCQSRNTECQSSTNRDVSRGACGQFWGFSPALHMYPEENKFILSLVTFKNTLSETVKTHIETSQNMWKASKDHTKVNKKYHKTFISTKNGSIVFLKVKVKVKKSLQKHCCKREGGYLSLSIMSKLCHHYVDVGGLISINMDLSWCSWWWSKTISSNL